MSALGILGAGLGILGAGGGLIALVTGALPFAGVLAALGGITPGRVLDFLKSPVGMITVLAVALLIAFGWGHHRGKASGDARCEARITKSVDDARAFDTRLAAEQHATMTQQVAEAETRLGDANRKVDDYARTHRSCEIGAPGADFLNGGRVPRGGEFQPVPTPPARPR
jgi:hypothetical protein